MKTKMLTLAFLTAVAGFLSGAETDCSKDVMFKFFPKTFVLDVLNDHDVPKEKAQTIADSLYDSDPEVVQLIGQKARNMNPNPLEDVRAENERAKLFRDSLAEVFTETLVTNGITDQQTISQMLDEIQQLRIQRFDQCRKEGRLPEIPTDNAVN